MVSEELFQKAIHLGISNDSGDRSKSEQYMRLTRNRVTPIRSIIIFRTTIAFQIHMPYLTNPKYQLFHASHLCFVSNNPVGNPSVEGPRGPQIQRSGPTTSCSSPRGPGIDVEPNVVSDEKHHDSRLLGLEFGV